MAAMAVRRLAASTAAAPVRAAAVLEDTDRALVRATAAARADLVGEPLPLYVETDAVTAEEEAALLAEVDRRVRTYPYEEGHFDAVIHHYRELLGFKHVSPAVAAVLERAQARTLALCGGPAATATFAFLPAHILDLRADGWIAPHVDNYCGRVVAALSLSAATVLRLTRPDRPDAVVDLYLPPRSFYCLQCVRTLRASRRPAAAHLTRLTGACSGMCTDTRYAAGRCSGAAHPCRQGAACPSSSASGRQPYPLPVPRSPSLQPPTLYRLPTAIVHPQLTSSRN
jgi:hypothetical protein